MSTPITSYGTITIVDLTDVGQYSVYPYANSSNTQIYSQENLSYSPNWTAQTPLIITPVITYAGEDKTTESLVKWYEKGADSDTLISTINAGVADKRLTITSNLTNVSYKTYIVVANYTSNTGAKVEARGEISFNKLIQTSTSKGVQITGTNVFKYQTGQASPTETSIVLTPTPQGEVGFATNAWEYWNGTAWIATSGISGLTENSTTHALTVQHTSPAFNGGDVAKFKVTVNALYNAETRSDIFTITKLRDGAAGGSLVQMDLSNDDQMIPLNSDGEAQWASIGNLAGTQITVFEGNVNKTANLGTGNSVKVYLTNVNAKTIKNFGQSGQTDSGGASLTPANTVSGYTMDLANGYDAILVTSFTQDGNNEYYTSGSVRFVLTYNGVTYSKIFSLIGIEAGEDGETPVVYALEFSDAVKRINNAAQGATTDSWVYYPTTLTVTAKSSNSTNTYAGAIWYKRKGDSSWTRLTTNGTANITVASSLTVDKSPVLFRLTTATASNCNEYFDQESILITSDGSVGKEGAQGDEGVSALNVVLTNENQSIRVTSDYKTIAQTLTTKYQGYIGTEATTFTYAGATYDQNVPSGLFGTIGVNQGVISIPINEKVNIASYLDGSITFGFTYTDPDDSSSTTTLYKKFTFDMNPRGENAITLQLIPSGATYFKNGSGSVTITPKLNNGSDISSSNYNVLWKNAITDASLGTGSTLTVSGSNVDGVLSVLCRVEYPKNSNKYYTQYISFTDYDDPLQVQLICTLGETIVNSIGEGVIYALTTQAGNSQALDYVMPGIAVDDTLTGHTEPQLFLLTKSQGAVTGITLKNKSGTTAGTYTNADLSTLSYSWSFRDIEGEPIDIADLKDLGMYISSGASGSDNGQFVYINANVIKKKLMCYVAVTKS